MQLDLDYVVLTRQIVTVAAPAPVFRPGNQSADYRIAVNVAQLFNVFTFAPDVEILISRLPERMACLPRIQFSGDDLLQHLQRNRQRPAFRFADEKMHVFRHHDITDHTEPVPLAYSLQLSHKHIPSVGREKRSTMVATEGNEVKLSSLLIPLQSPRHKQTVELFAVGFLR